MDPRLQRRVQRYGWDRAAEHYEGAWREQLRPAQDLMLAMAELKPGEAVVDVACGTGLVALPAARQVGPAGHVTATDISATMVERTAAAAAVAGLGNVSTARMGAEDLDLDDDTFDVALCGLGLMYVPDPVRSLAEMARVVRAGGRVAVAVWGARSRCGWADIFPIVDARVESEVCPLFFQLGTGDALAHAMEEAGLEEVEVRRIATELRYPDDDAALGAAFDGGPVALAYARFSEAVRAEAHEEYLASIAAYRGLDGYAIPGEFVVARGRVGA